MIKTAIGYVRISTSDQSNFSLDGQEEYIRNHCARHGIDLRSLFREDGESAKNFDRANWRALENYIKRYFREVDYLIVLKYDRFSRNLADALVMMNDLERKYSITVMSVMEPIGMHPDSPYYFQMRTQMLLGADVELRMIRDRTKFGMVQGARSGRFLHSAPLGYVNARDERDKPIIVVDPSRAHLVRDVFEYFLIGTPAAEILQLMTRKGLKLRGHSAVVRMISNPVYAGLIRVPAYYDEPEKLVEGLHQGIIDPATWWEAQELLTGKPTVRLEINPDVPLKGALHCSCGRLFTGDRNKGKSKHYWYYVCLQEKLRYNAQKLHSQFDAILDELSLPDHFLHYLKGSLESGVHEHLSVTKGQLKEVGQGLRENMATQESLEGKYLANTIDTDTYHRWKGRLISERLALEEKRSELSASMATPWERYSDQLSRLGDIRYLYSMADNAQKQGFIRLVFDDSLSYAEGAYRTRFLMPLFESKAMVLKEKGLLTIEEPSANQGKHSRMCPTGDSNRTHIVSLLEWAASVMEAA